MDSNFDIKQARHKLGFLYRHTAMKKGCVSCWLECDLFVKRVYEVVSSGEKLNDKVLLEIMQEVYDEIVANRDAFPDFKIRGARSGMHQLERALESQQNV